MNNNLVLKNKDEDFTNYHILFSFNMNENNNTYIAYTDFSKNENGDLKIFYGKFSNDNNERKIKDLESQDEIDLMNDIMKSASEEIKNA